MGPGRPPIDFGRPKTRVPCGRRARGLPSALRGARPQPPPHSAVVRTAGPVLRIQARTSARKAASVGVSSKSKVVFPPSPYVAPSSLCRPSPYVAPAPMAPECLRLPRQLCRDTVLPFPQCAEHHSKVLGRVGRKDGNHAPRSRRCRHGPGSAPARLAPAPPSRRHGRSRPRARAARAFAWSAQAA